MSNALPCIVCGRDLPHIDHDPEPGTNQPYNGTAFISHGHYGSTAYDPMDGHYLEINICDPCLVGHAEFVREGRNWKPVLDESIGERLIVIGREDIKAEPLRPWKPEPEVIEHVHRVASDLTS